MKDELPTLLLIDKPKGMSSFSVIRQLSRRTGVSKMGHAGTLDPLATGLMLIGVGKGTKSLSGLVGLDKEYIADIYLGESRTTSDMGGSIVTEKEYVGDVTEDTLTATLKNLLGEIELPVSAYSAIKVDGLAMYKRARRAAWRGEVVTDVPRRMMKVYEAELLNIKEVTQDGKKRLAIKIRFFVGSGTYIRSLAEEIGQQLGYPAVLADLRRTKVGEYRIEDAQKLEEFGTFMQEVVYRSKKLLTKIKRRVGI